MCREGSSRQLRNPPPVLTSRVTGGHAAGSATCRERADPTEAVKVRRARSTFGKTGQTTRKEAKRSPHVRSADAFEELKKEHADLQEDCQFLEARVQIYATALNLVCLENAAFSGREADAAKVRTLPR